MPARCAVLLYLVGAVTAAAIPAAAGEKHCYAPEQTCRQDAACDPQCRHCGPQVPHCCCLRKLWFLPAEPPRADILDTAAVRFDAAPLQNTMAYRVVQDERASQALADAVQKIADRKADEKSCANSAPDAPPSPPTPPAPATQSQADALRALQTSIENVNKSVINLGTQVKDLADDYKQYKQTHP